MTYISSYRMINLQGDDTVLNDQFTINNTRCIDTVLRYVEEYTLNPSDTKWDNAIVCINTEMAKYSTDIAILDKKTKMWTTAAKVTGIITTVGFIILSFLVASPVIVFSATMIWIFVNMAVWIKVAKIGKKIESLKGCEYYLKALHKVKEKNFQSWAADHNIGPIYTLGQLHAWAFAFHKTEMKAQSPEIQTFLKSRSELVTERRKLHDANQRNTKEYADIVQKISDVDEALKKYDDDAIYIAKKDFRDNAIQICRDFKIKDNAPQPVQLKKETIAEYFKKKMDVCKIRKDFQRKQTRAAVITQVAIVILTSLTLLGIFVVAAPTLAAPALITTIDMAITVLTAEAVVAYLLVNTYFTFQIFAGLQAIKHENKTMTGIKNHQELVTSNNFSMWKDKHKIADIDNSLLLDFTNAYLMESQANAISS